MRCKVSCEPGKARRGGVADGADGAADGGEAADGAAEIRERQRRGAEAHGAREQGHGRQAMQRHFDLARTALIFSPLKIISAAVAATAAGETWQRSRPPTASVASVSPLRSALRRHAAKFGRTRERKGVEMSDKENVDGRRPKSTSTDMMEMAYPNTTFLSLYRCVDLKPARA